MKAIISTFIAVICAAGAVIAQEQPALTGVGSLATKPSDYTGKIVAVSGIVELSPKESECLRLLMPPRQAARMTLTGP